MLQTLLFIGFEPSDLWNRWISNDAAEFVNITILILGTLSILVLFERWWQKQ